MSHKLHSLGRSMLILAPVLLLAVVLTGCFGDFAPMAPSNTDTQAGQAVSAGASRNAVYFGFSSEGTQRAGKLLAIPSTGKSVSKSIGAGGGELVVSERDILDAESAKDDITVTFTVPKNVLNQSVTIKMTVYGNELSQMLVAFEPSGLSFLKTATLSLKIGNLLVDIPVSQITAYHMDSVTGEVTSAQIISITEERDRLAILVAVPGFSRYGLAD